MKTLWVIFSIIFTNMLSFGLIIPLTPSFQKLFHLTPLQTGLLASTLPAVQILSSILLGYFSDRKGRKKILIFCGILTTLSYLLLAYASSYYEVLFSRLLTGISTGSLPIAMALASDISNTENRKKYMGIVGMGFGLGFMLGPSIGGLLAGFDNYCHNITLVSIIAATLSFFSVLFAILYLKESLPVEARAKYPLFITIVELIQNITNLLNYFRNAIISATIAGLEVFVSLWLTHKFNFPPIAIGIFWTIFALFSNLGRVLLIPYVKGYLSQAICFMIICFCFLMLVFVHSLVISTILLMITASIIGIIITTISTNISLNTKPTQQGLSFGLGNSIGNIGRTLGPFLVGLVMNINPLYFALAWIVITVINLVGTAITLLLYFKTKE